ncbi:MAG: hypothetical protein J2P17_04130 [Mycobacterium sp.]|nr:hypothetical protein [Mycobacterium sp.]
MSTYLAPLANLAPLTPSPSPGPSPTPPTASPTVPTPEPPGYGTLGFIRYWVKKYFWPQADPETVGKWAATHQHYAQQLDDAADTSQRMYVPLFLELLKGKSGNTLQARLAQNMNFWRQEAVEHRNAATALNDAADYLRGLQADLTGIIDQYEPQWDTAVKHRDIRTQGAIVGKLNQEVPAAVSHAAARISAATNGKFWNNPTQPSPPRPPAQVSV